jgi:hypothetical protein
MTMEENPSEEKFGSQKDKQEFDLSPEDITRLRQIAARCLESGLVVHELSEAQQDYIDVLLPQ